MGAVASSDRPRPSEWWWAGWAGHAAAGATRRASGRRERAAAARGRPNGYVGFRIEFSGRRLDTPKYCTSSFETVISDEILRNREIMGVWPLEAVKNSGQALGDR